MSALPHILVAGQFPPPVMGFSYITQQMAQAIATRYETTIVDLSAHRRRGGIGYHLRRIGLTLRGLIALVAQACHHPRRCFYVACEGDFGLVYTLVLCAVARLWRTPTFIHHHSFGYIVRPVPLMAVLVSVAGNSATHIFLCQTMIAQFVARYGKPVTSTIVSNSAFVGPVAASSRQGSGIVIGLLSNLNDQKGLGLFLGLLRRARTENLDIRGVLAGPPESDRDREVIESAMRELGAKLDYRGAVYGAAKDDFFRGIDVFVFPTSYINEAQPTVVYEALARGIPVLSYDRGCILSQVGSCGAVQQRDADFIPFALNWLRRHAAAPDVLARVKLDAAAAFKEDRALAQQAVFTLFEAFHDR